MEIDVKFTFDINSNKDANNYTYTIHGLLSQDSIINNQNSETILGDFEEQYYEIAQEKGLLAAKVWSLFQLITTVPSFINNSFSWSAIMFKNYLTIALRTIKRQKGYFFINIFR